MVQWSQVEKDEREAIHEQKIRCAYLNPIDSVGNESAITNGTNGSYLHPDTSVQTSELDVRVFHLVLSEI